MKRVKVNSMWWLALRMLLLPLATQATHANTVDIVHDGYGAVDEVTFWGAGYWGAGVMAGVYQLDKTGGTGAGDAWHNGSIAGFCIELQEPPPHTTTTYNVELPDDTYNDYLDEYVGSVKANYLRELWARYYDSSWAGAGTHTAQENSSAAAFAAAVWEIVYEDLNGHGGRMGRDTGRNRGLWWLCRHVSRRCHGQQVAARADRQRRQGGPARLQ